MNSQRDKNHILIVNDCKTTTTLLAKTLMKRGYRVRTTESVSEASYLIGHENIGTVLIDHYLEGLNNGIELVRKIKKYGIDITLLAFSSDREATQQMISEGCEESVFSDMDAILSYFPFIT